MPCQVIYGNILPGVINVPRLARQKGKFSIYHVIQRGNEKKKVFLTKEDYFRFLEILERMKKKYNFLLYAFCLMNNHIHLLIDDKGNDISQIIKSINICYVAYFNRIHNRCGHLFQDRFKSELVKDERYFLEVSRYIHNNPVKAGIVENPLDYKWSSYDIYSGNDNYMRDLIEVGKILGCFSNDLQKATKEYIEYVTKKEALEVKVMDIDDDINPKRNNSDYISTVEQALRKLEELAEDQGITSEVLIKDLRFRNEAIRQLRKNSSLTLKQLGFLFGNISETRISRIVGRG